MPESLDSMGSLYLKALNFLYRFRVVQSASRFSFNWLASLCKARPELVLCGAMNGQHYGDNSKYVYEWILQHRKDLSPIWMTRNLNVFRQLRQQGRPVALAWSPRGAIYLLRARVGVYTNSLRDLSYSPYAIPDRVQLIALRHGRSVKRVRFARKQHKISTSEQRERERESQLVRYAISTSDFVSDIQEECLQIGREKHVVTGYPRNDELFNPPPENQELLESVLAGKKGQKVILYAPSWRHGRDYTRFFPFNDFDKAELVSLLEQHNTYLLLRPHVGELCQPGLVGYLNELASGNDRVVMATHEAAPDVNSILPFIDILISDYSALYHDFLLLNRPMIFIPYDFQSFDKQNGFLYDYYNNLPGPNVTSYSDFANHLHSLLSGRDDYADARHSLAQKIHSYTDDQSTQRVVALIDQLRMQTENPVSNNVQ